MKRKNEFNSPSASEESSAHTSSASETSSSEYSSSEDEKSLSEHSSYEIIEEEIFSSPISEPFRDAYSSTDQKESFPLNPAIAADVDLDISDKVERTINSLANFFKIEEQGFSFFHLSGMNKILMERSLCLTRIQGYIYNQLIPLSSEIMLFLSYLEDSYTLDVYRKNDLAFLVYDKESKQLLSELPKEIFALELQRIKKSLTELDFEAVEMQLDKFKITPEYSFRIEQFSNQRIPTDSPINNINNLEELGRELSGYKVIGFNDNHYDIYITETIAKLIPYLKASHFCFEIPSYRQSRIDEWYNCQDKDKQEKLDEFLRKDILGGNPAEYLLFKVLKRHDIKIIAMDINTESDKQFAQEQNTTSVTIRIKAANEFFINRIQEALAESGEKTVIYYSGARHNRDLQDRLDVMPNVGKANNIIITISSKEVVEGVNDKTDLIVKREVERVTSEDKGMIANLLKISDLSLIVPVSGMSNRLSWINDQVTSKRRTASLSDVLGEKADLEILEEGLEIGLQSFLNTELLDQEKLISPSIIEEAGPYIIPDRLHYNDDEVVNYINHYKGEGVRVQLITPENSSPEVFEDSIPLGGIKALIKHLNESKFLEKNLIVFRVNLNTKGLFEEVSNHFVALYVEKSQMDDTAKVTYIDSMGEKIESTTYNLLSLCFPKMEYTQALTHNNRLQVYEIEKGTNIPKEGINDYDCGPFVTYLSSVITNNFKLPDFSLVDAYASKMISQYLRTSYKESLIFRDIHNQVLSLSQGNLYKQETSQNSFRTRLEKEREGEEKGKER